MGVKRPLVSIVTPTLDPGGRLRRCLESVAKQSYGHIEHLIIDGGSTDGTLELIEGLQDVRWVSEPDEGQASAINKGWLLSEGDILGWLNADDTLMPDTVARVVSVFEEDGSIGWVYGDVETHEVDRVYVRKGAPISRPHRWAARNLASQPGSFAARWALEKVGFLDQSFHYAMDLDLWLRLIDAGVPGRHIPQVLATFEVHGGSKSGSVPRSRFVEEEARARIRSGRTRSAAVAFGRMAALLALEADEDIEGELKAMDTREAAGLPRPLIAAGADAEMLVGLLKRRDLRALRFAVGGRWWRYPESRARVMDAARGLSASRRRVPRDAE